MKWTWNVFLTLEVSSGTCAMNGWSNNSFANGRFSKSFITHLKHKEKTITRDVWMVNQCLACWNYLDRNNTFETILFSAGSGRRVSYLVFYRPRSEGYVFTGVCHSVTERGGGGVVTPNASWDRSHGQGEVVLSGGEWTTPPPLGQHHHPWPTPPTPGQNHPPPPWTTPPPPGQHSPPQQHIYGWAVCILLECILVHSMFEDDGHKKVNCNMCKIADGSYLLTLI